MNTTQLDTKYGSIWYILLEHYLQGRVTPYSIGKELGLKESPTAFARIIDDPEFGRAVREARRNPTESAVARIKQNLQTYVSEMHNLATDPADKRTQVIALKDLMDRGGTGASHKISISSPTAYKAAVADLVEDETPALLEENPIEPDRPELTE